jgi:hypothetical protein
MSKGVMSSTRREIVAAMELRKKMAYKFQVLCVMDLTFARFRLILSKGNIFMFCDYLQSGLPDRRDEFIKWQGPGWYLDIIQSVWRLLKTRGCIVQHAGILPRSGALRKVPEK